MVHFWFNTYSRYLGSELNILTSIGQIAMKSGANHHVHHRINWNNYNKIILKFLFVQLFTYDHITVITFLSVVTVLFCCVLVSKCGLCRILLMVTIIKKTFSHRNSLNDMHYDSEIICQWEKIAYRHAFHQFCDLKIVMITLFFTLKRN